MDKIDRKLNILFESFLQQYSGGDKFEPYSKDIETVSKILKLFNLRFESKNIIDLMIIFQNALHVSLIDEMKYNADKYNEINLPKVLSKLKSMKN